MCVFNDESQDLYGVSHYQDIQLGTLRLIFLSPTNNTGNGFKSSPSSLVDALRLVSSVHQAVLVHHQLKNAFGTIENASLGVVGILAKEYITACEHQFDSIRPTRLRTRRVVDSTDATSAIAGSPLLKRQTKEPIDQTETIPLLESSKMVKNDDLGTSL